MDPMMILPGTYYLFSPSVCVRKLSVVAFFGIFVKMRIVNPPGSHYRTTGPVGAPPILVAADQWRSSS